ncbi:protein SSUH2 homolog [Watersipora subatra]|uniref:protein SSUH2 homolog n=1 Tax=Watersipora subatra TaxID=2589382 RepID=UPI00355B54A7
MAGIADDQPLREGVVIQTDEFVDDELVEPERMEFGSAANITRTEAREALLNYVAQYCCFGKGAAKELMMLKVVPSNAMHYTLETFCEGRYTTYDDKPYQGGAVDGSHNGSAPDPWTLRANPSQMFQDERQYLRIPHTSEVRVCSTCQGSRKVTCGFCRGSGFNKCNSCSGRGEKDDRDKDGNHITKRCTSCNGRGETRCSSCNGSGQQQCYHCNGYGKVEVFRKLNIVYKNHVADYVLEGANLPSILVRRVQGVEIFSQTDRKVWPITKFPVHEINQHSVDLVNLARKGHPKERQLQQRQTLTAVPVTRIDYAFKKFKSSFWVYGLQREVYAPDYPQQKCCGCSIL